MKPEKALQLFKEAKQDYKTGNYNKTVSASYFACRMLAEHVVEKKQKHIPKRDDKLANIFKSWGEKLVYRNLTTLYVLRVETDYGTGQMTKNMARKALNMAEKTILRLSELNKTAVADPIH